MLNSSVREKHAMIICGHPQLPSYPSVPPVPTEVYFSVLFVPMLCSALGVSNFMARRFTES